jgi:hypothetical protein
VRHVPETKLRRLVDEPWAVADTDADHVANCVRCGLRRQQIRQDAATATALLSRPQSVPDLDGAWSRLQTAPRALAPVAPRSRRPRVQGRWRWRLVAIPVPSARVLATVAVVVAAAAGATALTTALSPTRRAPVPASSAGIQALADVVGIDGGSGVLGGFDTSSGSLRLPFGVLQWSSAGTTRRVASIAAAEKATGLDLPTPASLPAGVGKPTTLLVQPQVTATIRFDTAAGALAGRSLTVTAGPAVLVEYGASTGAVGLPTLATFAMGRPLVSSKDSKAAQLEAYVLSRPDVPAGLAQEIRLLGDIGTVLPVPTPPGANVTQVDVSGSPGILITDASVGASGVIWEDHDGGVHAAVGLLDRTDILNVADQLG